MIIYTIGHSNKSKAEFLSKLKQHSIQVVIDVRSKPYSRFRHFCINYLQTYLPQNKILYLPRGQNLGGLKENIDFDQTILEVIDLAKEKRIVLMCSEGDYHKCHRHTLLAPKFEEKNVIIEHITWQKKTDQPSLFKRQVNM